MYFQKACFIIYTVNFQWISEIIYASMCPTIQLAYVARDINIQGSEVRGSKLKNLI